MEALMISLINIALFHATQSRDETSQSSTSMALVPKDVQSQKGMIEGIKDEKYERHSSSPDEIEPLRLSSESIKGNNSITDRPNITNISIHTLTTFSKDYLFRNASEEQKIVLCGVNGALIYDNKCVLVSFVEITFTIPKELKGFQCRMNEFINRIIFYASNGRPSLRLQPLERTVDGLGKLTVHALGETIRDPYMVKMMNRMYGWVRQKLIHPESLNFNICPNSHERLCKSIQHNPESVDTIYWTTNEPCEDCEYSGLIGIFSDRLPESVTMENGQGDPIKIDMPVRRANTPESNPLQEFYRLTTLYNTISKLNVTDSKVRSLPAKSIDNGEHGSVISEELEFLRCCYCKAIDKTIRYGKKEICNEIDLSQHLTITASELFHSLLQHDSIEYSLNRSKYTQWFIDCMHNTAYISKKDVNLKFCHQRCKNEMKYFRKYNISRHPALAWKLDITTNPFSLTHSSQSSVVLSHVTVLYKVNTTVPDEDNAAEFNQLISHTSTTSIELRSGKNKVNGNDHCLLMFLFCIICILYKNALT